MNIKELTSTKGNISKSYVNLGLALNVLIYAEAELGYNSTTYNEEYAFNYSDVFKIYTYILKNERDFDYSIFQDTGKLDKIIKELFDMEDIE